VQTFLTNQKPWLSQEYLISRLKSKFFC